jgi:hypothetical protein
MFAYFSASTELLASSAINASPEPSASSAINTSLEPRPRAQSTPCPSPRPWAQSTPRLSPRPQAQSMPRLSLGLGASLLIYGGRTSDATCAMPPTLQQGTSSTIPTTPITVAPHLCHCEHCTIVGGMGEVNPGHCNHTLAVTILLLQVKP